MTYALDTNIVSYLLRGDILVTKRWRHERTIGHNFIVPMIVYFEIKRGLISSQSFVKLNAFEKLCTTLKIEMLDMHDLNIACDLYAELKKHGQSKEDADILIAAQSISRNLTLVTNNVRHFANIGEIKIVNWVGNE